MLTMNKRKEKKNGDKDNDDNNTILQNDDDDDDDDNDNDSEQISLIWLEKKFGRMLEIFLIIQFAIGICLFFTGIFFLVWAVASIATLQAGSYMLLAFFIIGRALLGIIGYYTENFCLLFSYGCILLATFVLRTIIIMVRLKIMVSPDHQLHIPPLLQAAPGAMSTYWELLLAIFECVQVFGCFYLCWIWQKKRSIEKAEDETKLSLSIANEVARYLQLLSSSTSLTTRKSIIMIDDDKSMMEKRRKSSVYDPSSAIRKQSIQQPCSTSEQKNTNVNTNSSIDNNCNNNGKNNTTTTQQQQSSLTTTSIPLKSILHQPTVTTPFNRQQQQETTSTTQTHQQPFNAINEYHHQCPAMRHMTQPQQSTIQSIQHEYFEPPPLIDDDDEELQKFIDINNNNQYGRIGNYHQNRWYGYHHPQHQYQHEYDPPYDEYDDDGELSRVRSPVPPYERPFNNNELPLLLSNRASSNHVINNYGSTAFNHYMIDDGDFINDDHSIYRSSLYH